MIKNLVKLPGGVGDETPTSNVDPTQLSIGVQIEMEHTNNPDIAKEIAMDHLTEDPQYYTKLVNAGLAKEFQPGTGSGFGDPTTSFNDPARIGPGGLKKGNMHGSIGGTSDGRVYGRSSEPIVNKTIDIELEEAKKKKRPKPTNPALWARAKAAARAKFDVYPSAYANGWAAKWYKSKGGGWRMSEDFDVSKFMPGSPPMFGSFGLPDKDQTSIDVKNVANALKNKLIGGAKELKRIFSEESSETREMLSILRKIHSKIEVTPEQKKKATQQFFDLLRIVGLAVIFKKTFKIPFSSEAIYVVAHLLNKYTGIQILPSSMVKEQSVVGQVFDGPSPGEASPDGIGTYSSGYDFVGYAENKENKMKKEQFKNILRKLINETIQEQDMEDNPEGDETDGGEVKTQNIVLNLDRDTAQKLHDMLMAQLATKDDTEGGVQQPVASDMTDDQLPPEASDDMEDDMEVSDEEQNDIGEITFEQSKEIGESKKKWIQQAINPAKKGALKKTLGVKKGGKIPVEKLKAAAKKGGKTGQRARLAMTLSKLKKK